MKKVYDALSNKPFKIFYNTFIPKDVRKRWSYVYSEIPRQREVAEYWHNIINRYIAGELERYDIQPKKDFLNKKIIWQYWGQGLDDLPDIVKVCFASIDSFKNDYQIIRITDKTVKDYIDLPDFVYQKRNNPQFKTAFFSDLLRVSLINAYGGVWLDASVLLTDYLPKKYEQYDIFMFSRDPHSVNKSWGDEYHCYFSWQDEFHVRCLNSVIYGRKKSEISTLMVDLLLNFWKSENTIRHYFFFQIMFNELRNMQVINFDLLVEDDTLPHLLQGRLQDVYDERDFEQITSQVSIHKLTVHKNFKEKVSGKLTYYGYLKQSFQQT